VANVEWKPGKLIRALGSSSPPWRCRAQCVVSFYNQRGTPQQWLKRQKEREGAIKWTRLSCHTFVGNAVGLHLQALAYNLGNFNTDFGDAQGGRADQRSGRS